MTRDEAIPERMMPAIRRYIEHGIQPGDFLTAVICNDLKGAIGRADDENIGALQAYVRYFYNDAPAACWGSPENMWGWMASFKQTTQFERQESILNVLERGP